MKTESLTKRIERRAQLETELKALGLENSDTGVRLQSIGRKILDARHLVDVRRQEVKRHEGRDSGSVSYRTAKRWLEAAEKDLLEHTEERALLESRASEIGQRRAAIREEIAHCNSGASGDEVLAHKEALQEAKSRAGKLRGLIAEQESVLSENDNTGEAEIDALQQRRETLLADIAAGDAESGELESLDTEIATLVNDDDGNQAASLERHRSANQTIAGLRRKLADAEVTLSELQAKTPLVLEQFITSEAEQIGAEYAEHAQKSAQLFMRLKVLQELAGQVTGNSDISFLNGNWYRFFLPALQLKSVPEGAPQHAGRGALFSIQVAGDLGELGEIKAAELARFHELGIRELFTPKGRS